MIGKKGRPFLPYQKFPYKKNPYVIQSEFTPSIKISFLLYIQKTKAKHIILITSPAQLYDISGILKLAFIPIFKFINKLKTLCKINKLEIQIVNNLPYTSFIVIEFIINFIHSNITATTIPILITHP